MPKMTLAAAFGAAVVAMSVASTAAALTLPAGGAFQCQRVQTASHTHPLTVYCNARTPEGAALLRPVNCDPATMTEAAMRANCGAANAQASTAAPR